jgi:hypothetical protein
MPNAKEAGNLEQLINQLHQFDNRNDSSVYYLGGPQEKNF